MSVLRVYRAQETGSTSGKVRIYRVQETGTAVTTGKLRIYRAQETGTPAVGVRPFTPNPLIVEPDQVTTLVALMLDGTTADSYTWRRVSGNAGTVITGTGNTVTVKAPSIMPPGGNVVIGVIATVAGVSSPEQTMTFTVLPQLEWARVPGQPWAGASLIVPA